MVGQLNYISYPYIKDQNKECNELTAIIIIFSHCGRFCHSFIYKKIKINTGWVLRGNRPCQVTDTSTIGLYTCS
jgi:hypothetical protein